MLNSINFLDGGEATYMGDDTFVLSQVDDFVKKPQRVVVTADDMRAMLATLEG